MTQRRADVCIIGGGLVGLFSSLFLRRRGRSVVLIEKGTCGREASGVNFGNMRLQGRNQAEYPLALSAHDLWERFDAITGEHLVVERCGQAFIALGADQHARLERITAEACAAGINVDRFDKAEIGQRWPGLSSLVTGASWSPRDAVSEPAEATAAMVRAVRRAGATILDGTEVTAVTRARSGSDLEVHAADGVGVIAGHVLNAAGAWAGRIAAQLGEPVPMFAAGPQLILTTPVAPQSLPSMLAADGSIIFRQRLDGRILTTMFPRLPGDLDKGMRPVEPSQVVRTLTRLGDVVPALGNVTAELAWSGVEGYLPDMLPVISPSGTTPGVVHAFGFSGHGYQLAPGLARAVTDIICSGRAGVPLNAFDIGRFKGDVAPDERLQREFDPVQVAGVTATGKAS